MVPNTFVFFGYLFEEGDRERLHRCFIVIMSSTIPSNLLRLSHVTMLFLTTLCTYLFFD